MAENTAINLDVTNNADGFSLAGGTTIRTLTVTGANITMTGSGSNTYTYPAATGTLVSRDSTDTLTNKTIDGDDNTVQDLPYSAIKSTSRTGTDVKLVTGTAGTSGDLVIWDANGDAVDGPTPPSGTIVGTSDTQTLTNKTLTSPTINSPVINSGVALTASSTELNFTDGLTVTTTQANNFFSQLHLSAGQSASAQSISDNTTTTVTLDSETFDPGSDFASNVYTVPIDGKYLILGQVTFQSPNDGTPIQAILAKNPSGANVTIARHQYSASGTGTQGVQVFALASFVAGDTIALRAYHAKGSSMSLLNNVVDTFMHIIFLSH